MTRASRGRGGFEHPAPSLAEQDRIPRELALRLASTTGFWNLVAHRYGVLDPARVHAMASRELGDLLDFCDAVSGAATKQA